MVDNEGKEIPKCNRCNDKIDYLNSTQILNPTQVNNDLNVNICNHCVNDNNNGNNNDNNIGMNKNLEIKSNEEKLTLILMN